MSEENKAIIRRVFNELLNQADMSVIDEIDAPDFVWHGPGGQEVRGPEAHKQLAGSLCKAFVDLHFTIEDMIAEGDKVVARWTLRGTHKGDLMGVAPTGKQVTLPGILISRIAEGRVAEDWDSYDQLDLMRQLGVLPRKDQSG